MNMEHAPKVGTEGGIELRRRQGLRRGRRIRRILTLVGVIVVLGSATAVLFHLPGIGSRGSEEAGGSITLLVDFGPEELPVHPGNLTTWRLDGGEWHLISIVDEDPAWRFENMSGKDGTVLGYLEMAAEAAGFTIETSEYIYGRFVESIAGVKNGRDDRNWLYWVDGDFANMAADRYFIEDGGEICWKYTTYE